MSQTKKHFNAAYGPCDKAYVYKKLTSDKIWLADLENWPLKKAISSKSRV